MTAYTAILNSEIDPDSPVTTGLMTKLRDNPIAITEKASGAPVLANNYITEAMINSSAVSQTKLKTATGQVSTISTSWTTATLPGGEYGFYPYVSKGGAGSSSGYDARIFEGSLSLTGTSNTTVAAIKSNGTFNFYINQRYIQSSPPYDLGAGEIELFVFLLADKKTNRIITSVVAQDPPWANNGNTQINADIIVDGKKYKKLSRFKDLEDISKTGLTIEDAIEVDEVDYLEITTQYKNADMDAIPHPFLDYDKENLYPVMLRPQGVLFEQILDMFERGDNVGEFILSGRVVLGQWDRNYPAPKGVTVMDAYRDEDAVLEVVEPVEEVKPTLMQKLLGTKIRRS